MTCESYHGLIPLTIIYMSDDEDNAKSPKILKINEQESTTEKIKTCT